MAERLKFALFGNIYQAKKSASVKQLISLLAAHDAELYIDTDFYTTSVRNFISMYVLPD